MCANIADRHAVSTQLIQDQTRRHAVAYGLAGNGPDAVDQHIHRDETQHVGRSRRHERATAPQAHGDLCVPVSDRGADACLRGCNRRQLRARRLDLSDGGRPTRSSRAITSEEIIVAQLNPHSIAAPSSPAACSTRTAWSRRPAREIASILVQARPERLDEVEAAIVALGRMRDPRPRSQGQARRRGRRAGCRLARDHAQQHRAVARCLLRLAGLPRHRCGQIQSARDGREEIAMAAPNSTAVRS